MKRIFAVLIALGAITAASAQYGPHDQSRDIILGQSNRNMNNTRYDNYSMTARDHDRQVSQINREFDQRIQAIQWNRYLRNGEKRRQIRSLEAQRNEELRQANERYYKYNRNNSYDRNLRRY